MSISGSCIAGNVGTCRWVIGSVVGHPLCSEMVIPVSEQIGYYYRLFPVVWPYEQHAAVVLYQLLL